MLANVKGWQVAMGTHTGNGFGLMFGFMFKSQILLLSYFSQCLSVKEDVILSNSVVVIA